MYIEELPTGDLEQGDVILGAVIPVITDRAQFISDGGGELIEGSVDTALSMKPAGMYVLLSQAPVLVLSQSCDLVGMRDESRARILVSSAVRENDARFEEPFDKDVKSLGDKVRESFINSAKRQQKNERLLPDAFKKAENSRQENLERLWLGT